MSADYIDLLKRHDEKVMKMRAAYLANPPSYDSALSRLKAFREYLEWSIQFHVPISELAVCENGRPMPERSARRFLANVNRLIAWLQCDEIDVIHEELIELLGIRLPFESQAV